MHLKNLLSATVNISNLEHQILMCITAGKVSKYGVFSGLYFSVFSPNIGKYRPEKTPYLDTFHAVMHINI